MSLKNKVAIVTGGNSGIGQAIVLELARQEASIVIDYVVHPEATEMLERQISKLGGQSIGVTADVSKCADLEKLVDAAVERFVGCRGFESLRARQYNQCVMRNRRVNGFGSAIT